MSVCSGVGEEVLYEGWGGECFWYTSIIIDILTILDSHYK